jgi:chromosome segregation ATPase
MSILDEYNQENEDDGSKKAAPANVRKQRAEIERQIVMSESDLKKVIREKEDFENQQRRLKKEEERIRIERDALDTEIKKLENRQMPLEEEIKRLKKKLKILM